MTDTVNDSAHVPQARPAIFTFAVLGSKTRKGGTISHVSTGIVLKGHPVACVGDIVTYRDGSQSRIISGAGVASVYKGKPRALIGSVTDNGDVITESPRLSSFIQLQADQTVEGFLQPGFGVEMEFAALERHHVLQDDATTAGGSVTTAGSTISICTDQVFT